MPENSKIICPDCGVEMNHHAEKIDFTAALDDPAAIDPDFGGVLEEVHSCSECGKAEMRRKVNITPGT